MGRYLTNSPSTYNLGLRINRYCVSFYKSVFIVLGKPDYINFWWSDKEHILLVGPADVPNSLSLSLKGYSCFMNHSPTICNSKLVKAIKQLIGGGIDKQYKLRGDYIPELNMVAFRTGIIINSK